MSSRFLKSQRTENSGFDSELSSTLSKRRSQGLSFGLSDSDEEIEKDINSKTPDIFGDTTNKFLKSTKKPTPPEPVTTEDVPPTAAEIVLGKAGAEKVKLREQKSTTFQPPTYKKVVTFPEEESEKDDDLSFLNRTMNFKPETVKTRKKQAKMRGTPKEDASKIIPTERTRRKVQEDTFGQVHRPTVEDKEGENSRDRRKVENSATPVSSKRTSLLDLMGDEEAKDKPTAKDRERRRAALLEEKEEGRHKASPDTETSRGRKSPRSSSTTDHRLVRKDTRSPSTVLEEDLFGPKTPKRKSLVDQEDSRRHEPVVNKGKPFDPLFDGGRPEVAPRRKTDSGSPRALEGSRGQASPRRHDAERERRLRGHGTTERSVDESLVIPDRQRARAQAAADRESPDLDLPGDSAPDKDLSATPRQRRQQRGAPSVQRSSGQVALASASSLPSLSRNDKGNLSDSSFCDETEKEASTLRKEAAKRRLEEKRRKRELAAQSSEHQEDTMAINAVIDAQTESNLDSQTQKSSRLTTTAELKTKTFLTNSARLKERVQPRVVTRPQSAQRSCSSTEDPPPTEFTDSNSLRDSVYDQWYRTRITEAKKKLKEKNDQESEEKAKKEKEEKDREIDRAKAFDCWRDSKKGSLHDIAKRKKLEEKKVEDEKKKEDEKKNEAKKAFECWNQKKTETLVKSKRKEETAKQRTEREEKESKELSKKDAESAFQSWKSKKDVKSQEMVKSQKTKTLTDHEIAAQKDKEEEEKAKKAFVEWELQKKKNRKKNGNATTTDLTAARRAWRPNSCTVKLGC